MFGGLLSGFADRNPGIGLRTFDETVQAVGGNLGVGVHQKDVLAPTLSGEQVDAARETVISVGPEEVARGIKTGNPISERFRSPVLTGVVEQVQCGWRSDPTDALQVGFDQMPTVVEHSQDVNRRRRHDSTPGSLS